MLKEGRIIKAQIKTLAKKSTKFRSKKRVLCLHWTCERKVVRSFITIRESWCQVWELERDVRPRHEGGRLPKREPSFHWGSLSLTRHRTSNLRGVWSASFKDWRAARQHGHVSWTSRGVLQQLWITLSCRSSFPPHEGFNYDRNYWIFSEMCWRSRESNKSIIRETRRENWQRKPNQ